MSKIGAIVIHCASYKERKENVDNIEHFFENTDVSFIIVEGVISNKILYDARFEHNIPLTKGQIGCSLAHMNALKTAIDMDFDYVFIFEDDLEIRVDNYSILNQWINNLPKDNDICLLTNIGTFEGVGHDNRKHKNTTMGDILYTSCPFGTQAYYIKKNIIKLLYDTQLRYMGKDKLYIADGLHIHCKKEPGVYLKIVTPTNTDRFFKHIGFTNSIVNQL